MSEVQSIQKILQDDSRINGAILHGSFGTERQHEKSDLDIALDLVGGVGLDALARLELSAKLAEYCKADLDLGVLGPDALVYSVRAIDQGTVLFVKNKFQHDLKIATIMAQYARLKEDRLEVEKAYASG